MTSNMTIATKPRIFSGAQSKIARNDSRGPSHEERCSPGCLDCARRPEPSIADAFGDFWDELDLCEDFSWQDEDLSDTPRSYRTQSKEFDPTPPKRLAETEVRDIVNFNKQRKLLSMTHDEHGRPVIHKTDDAWRLRLFA